MRYFLLFMVINFSVQAQRYNTPQSYLKFIDDNHEKVIEQTWNYMYSHSQEPNLQKRNGQRKVLENVLKRAIRNIEKEKPFDKDLQQAAVKYLNGNLAIVKEDYVQLLKLESSKEPLVDKSTIFRKIRNAMYQLRQDYDSSINTYAQRYDLTINVNNNQLAQKMAATIKIYDHYNEMNILVQQIKDAEAYLWQDIAKLNPQQFHTRLQDLNNVVKNNKKKAIALSSSIDIESLQPVYDNFSHFFGMSYTNHTAPIIEYLTVARNGDRSDIMHKTEAFNKAKTWFNLNRRESYTLWSSGTSNYINNLISNLD